MSMDITRIESLCACPCCGRPNDSVTAADGSEARPSPGDLAMCFGCGAFLTFDDKLLQRELSLEEVGALPDDDRIALQRARARWQKIAARSAREDS